MKEIVSCTVHTTKSEQVLHDTWVIESLLVFFNNMYIVNHHSHGYNESVWVQFLEGGLNFLSSHLVDSVSMKIFN